MENLGRNRDAGERAQLFQQGGIERQRHEARTSLDELEAELFGDLVGETGRAHFRDRLAARRHDEAFRLDDAAGCRDAETGAIMGDGRDGRFQPQLRIHRLHFAKQHADDVLGAVIAKELAERLFVPGDAVFFDKGDEIARRITGERGFGEMRIGGEIILWPGVDIGEVAAAAAGDADLFARRFRMVENDDGAAALAGADGAHHASGARPQNQHVTFLCHHSIRSVSFPLFEVPPLVNGAFPLANCQTTVMMAPVETQTR